MLIHKPAELSWEEAAGIPETWITATQALYLVGGFAEGKSVLWHAGASSVSISGQQLSWGGGASAVYATARSQDKCDFCVKELGATGAFNQTKDWADEVLKATDGKGVDLIVDFIGGPTFAGNIKALARDGVCVCLGQMGGMTLPAETEIGALVYKRITYVGSTLRSRDEDYQGKLRDQLVDHALPKFKDGSFKVHIERVMDWKDIIEAHELMESNKTKVRTTTGVMLWSYNVANFYFTGQAYNEGYLNSQYSYLKIKRIIVSTNKLQERRYESPSSRTQRCSSEVWSCLIHTSVSSSKSAVGKSSRLSEVRDCRKCKWRIDEKKSVVIGVKTWPSR
jgi:hypothetical protein